LNQARSGDRLSNSTVRNSGATVRVVFSHWTSIIKSGSNSDTCTLNFRRPSPLYTFFNRWEVTAAAGLVLMTLGTGVSQFFPSFDREIFLAIHLGSAGSEPAVAVLSVLGLGASSLLLVSASGPSHPRPFATLLLAVIVGGLVVQALKYGLAVPRPLAVMGPDVVTPVGLALSARAMPSGHAACALALLICLALDPRRHRFLVIVAMVLALGICWSRIAAGAHWPSDVVVGAGLGMVIASLVCGQKRSIELVSSIEAAMQRPPGARLTAALLVVTAAFLWVSEREQPTAESTYAAVAAWGLATALTWWRADPVPRSQRLATGPTSQP
jgi:membrane-associated phospholipid phosphatase